MKQLLQLLSRQIFVRMVMLACSVGLLEASVGSDVGGRNWEISQVGASVGSAVG